MPKYLLAIIFLMASIAIFSAGNLVFAEETNSSEPKIGVSGFLDEDGDGFNDLMPDGDGDGVPDALDPDYRNRQSDSVFMLQQRDGMGDTTGVHHRDLPGDDLRHPMFHDGMGPWGPGEPGQYGPGDSTGHGGMRDGHWRDGHHGGDMGGDPDTSGMGGGGGHRPKIDPRGGDKNQQTHEDIIQENTSITSHEGLNNKSNSDHVKDGSK